MDGGAFEFMSLDDVRALVFDVLVRTGANQSVAASLAESVEAAERNGCRDIGLAALPQIVEHIRSGRVGVTAIPKVTWTAPATMTIEAQGGFCDSALENAIPELADRAHQLGVCTVRVTQAYPLLYAERIISKIMELQLAGIGQCVGITAQSSPSGAPTLCCENLQVQSSQLAGRVTRNLLGAFGLPNDFSGPVGTEFDVNHWFLLTVQEQLPVSATTLMRDNTEPARSDGVSVQVRLLEEIINA